MKARCGYCLRREPCPHHPDKRKPGSEEPAAFDHVADTGEEPDPLDGWEEEMEAEREQGPSLKKNVDYSDRFGDES